MIGQSIDSIDPSEFDRSNPRRSIRLARFSKLNKKIDRDRPMPMTSPQEGQMAHDQRPSPPFWMGRLPFAARRSHRGVGWIAPGWGGGGGLLGLRLAPHGTGTWLTSCCGGPQPRLAFIPADPHSIQHTGTTSSSSSGSSSGSGSGGSGSSSSGSSSSDDVTASVAVVCCEPWSGRLLPWWLGRRARRCCWRVRRTWRRRAQVPKARCVN